MSSFSFNRNRSSETLVAPQSRAAEAYRRMRAMVDLAAGEQGGIRLVTSPGAGGGTTTMVANLGLALASASRPVLLIDGNLYRPRLHTVFGLDNEVGLTSVISGHAALRDAVHALPDHPGVYVLTAGPPVVDPAALLSSPAAELALASSTEVAPVVFVDGPPLLPVTGGVVLAGLASGVLLVARSGKTSQPELTDALELLESTGTSVLGVALNAVPTEGADRFRYRDRRYSTQRGLPEDDGPLLRSADPSSTGTARGTQDASRVASPTPAEVTR